jgi:hypothetical protein
MRRTDRLRGRGSLRPRDRPERARGSAAQLALPAATPAVTIALWRTVSGKELLNIPDYYGDALPKAALQMARSKSRPWEAGA